MDAQTLRGAVLGCLDGLTSILALVVGMHVSGVSPRTVLISGLVASVAGSLSMGVNEVISMHSYNDHADPASISSPWRVGVASAVSFLVGSAIPLGFYAPHSSILLVVLVGLVSLYLLGALSAGGSEKRRKAGLRALVLGSLACLITLGLGWLIGGFV